ncbi:MAG: DEAD/DEAH box helicase [Pseudomonadota bacterium]
MSDFSLPEHFDLSEHFDHRTLTQAMLLEPQQAVLSRHIEGEFLQTRLRGGGTQAYEQTISFYVDPRTGLHLRGLCTCSIGFNCKHVAASLMAFEAQALRDARASAGQGGGAATPSAASGQVPAQARATSPTSRVSGAAAGPVMPRVLELWLSDVTAAAKTLPSAEAPRQAPNRCLMYVFSAQGLRLKLNFHLGHVRKGGQVSSHRPHSPSPIDMLRSRPAYLSPADDVLLAALLPFSMDRWGAGAQLHGATAVSTVAQLARSGQAWFAGGPLAAAVVTLAASMTPASALPNPPGPPLEWSDDTVSLRLAWRADEQGQWRTAWEIQPTQDSLGASNSETAEDPSAEAGTQAVVLLLLPEPHAYDPVANRLQPARLKDVNLPMPVLETLASMPPVPTEVLPDLVRRLETVGLSRGMVIPLPQEHAQEVQDIGALALQPVLRLVTCPNMPSEMWLEGHQRPPPAGQPARQAAVQLLFRYRLPAAAHRPARDIDFHFPAGASDGIFLDRVPAERNVPLTRFSRDPAEEVAVIERIFNLLQLRPWSRVAGWALERMAALKAGLLQSGQLPPALQDGQLVVVPVNREQWPRLLSEQLPLLQAEGWAVERDDDFPYEMYQADDFEINLGDEPGGGQHWFRVGLKVSVAGQPVDLVPLLVGLVQAGWLTVEAALRDPQGEVLLPWPHDATSAPAALPGRTAPLRRERLLRLPVARVAPLVAWLRSVYLQQGQTQMGELPRLSRFELGALETFSAGMRVNAPPSLTALLNQLRQLRTGQGLPAVAVSPHVNAQLRPYQLDGLTWMDFLRRAQFGGILADDMGLGKTLQTLSLLQGELDAGRLDRPSLVVVPTSLLGNWQAEAQRFTPQLKVLVLHGKQRVQQFAQITKVHLVVTSYPLAVRDITVLTSTAWHYLILDEAQRIKNSRSQAAMVLKSLQSQHRLCLSGTPIENHLGELWSLMDFVSPGLLGQEAQFREHYRLPIEKRQDAVQADNLARRVRPFVLRRTKNEVARELPEKTETLLRVELDGTQRDLYETVRATMDKKLRDAIAQQGLARSHIVVLDALLKLRQVCCDPRLLKANETAKGLSDASTSAKLELLLDLLPTLVEDGRRILVFSQFTEMLALIEPELQRLQLGYLKLTGDTVDRGAMVAEFQEGSVPIFLISLKAGGVGLNLTAADTVILYDPWWNPAVEQQAIDRAYRIGQGKAVFVYKLVASGTVEEKMLELQARKAGLADALLGGVASDASLTAQDFDELFKPLGG